jgi:hypothetical protein
MSLEQGSNEKSNELRRLNALIGMQLESRPSRAINSFLSRFTSKTGNLQAEQGIV